ncbi:MAG: ABC transporter substrate-binding protein [Acutalibacteraceae bacterium]
MTFSAFKKCTALFLAAALLLALAGCGETTEDVSTQTQVSTEVNSATIRYNDLRLPYAKADSLDPFEAKSAMNRQLSTLMYDSLFTVGENFEAKPLLAKEYLTDGLTVTVSVNTGVRFTDGTLMSVTDILYSFDAAKESAVYKARLSNIESASAAGDNVLLFQLASPDPYAVACLDFPIIKTGTSAEDRERAAEAMEDEEDDSQKIKSTDKVVPVGSGRYILQYAENEADPELVAFNDRFKGFFPTMTTIQLVNVTDSSALFYSLEIGNISFAFDDLSSGKYTRVNATISEYPMNNLVYLGMNQDDSALAIPAVRQAIEAAIDREDILNVAFQGHATVTHTPFNPLWTEASAYEGEWTKGEKTAQEILEEAGFDKINSYGVRNNGRISLNFTLIVPEDNNFKWMTAQQIAKKLKTLNIKVNITAMPSEKFLTEVELGHFDLYVGEVALSANMSMDAFFGGSGAMAHGIWARTAADAYYSFLAGEINFNAFMEAFKQDMPFVPLCFRKGIVASVKELQNTQDARYGDLYEDIEDWHF